MLIYQKHFINGLLHESLGTNCDIEPSVWNVGPQIYFSVEDDLIVIMVMMMIMRAVAFITCTHQCVCFLLNLFLFSGPLH